MPLFLLVVAGAFSSLVDFGETTRWKDKCLYQTMVPENVVNHCVTSTSRKRKEKKRRVFLLMPSVIQRLLHGNRGCLEIQKHHISCGHSLHLTFTQLPPDGFSPCCIVNSRSNIFWENKRTLWGQWYFALWSPEEKKGLSLWLANI